MILIERALLLTEESDFAGESGYSTSRGVMELEDGWLLD